MAIASAAVLTQAVQDIVKSAADDPSEALQAIEAVARLKVFTDQSIAHEQTWIK